MFAALGIILLVAGAIITFAVDKTAEGFDLHAIGWILRETGKPQPAVVRAWLEPRAARAAGLTVREAVKHLPAADRAAILAAREGGKVPRAPRRLAAPPARRVRR